MQNGHPVYVTPSKDVVIPPEFPLNDRGQIFCGTCHTAGKIDQQAEDLTPQEYTRKVFPRQENVNSSLCKSCHVRQASNSDTPSPEGFNHRSDFVWNKLSPELREYGGKMGTVKNMIICETCHTVHRGQGKKLLIMDNSNSELCGTCHAGEYASNRENAELNGTHSVNIVPIKAEISRTILNQGGRLGKQGKLLCLTCHRVHNAPVKQNLLVRENRRSSLCIECHQQQYENIKGSKHDLGISAPREKNILGQTVKQAGVCSPCHLAHNGAGAKMWAKPLAGGQSDIISQLCNSCHSPDNCAAEKTTGRISHTVGPGTEAAGRRVKLPFYSPAGQVLAGGQLTCATCHNVHRWDPQSRLKRGIARREGDHSNSFLRKRNTRSALCFTCHSDKALIQGTEHDPQLALLPGENLKTPSTNQEDRCSPCHTVHNAKAAMLWNRELGPGDDDISRICASCHAPGKAAQAKLVGEHSHPVNTKTRHPGRGGKLELPLFNLDLKRDPARGRVLCNSCHDTHRWDPKLWQKGPGKRVEGDASNSFLRISAEGIESNLCYKCHQDKVAILGSKHDINHVSGKDSTSRSAERTAGGVCGTCHTVHNAPSEIRQWVGKLGAGKDGISKLCNGCHADNNKTGAKSVGQYSHPINVSLAEAVSTSLPTYDEDLNMKPQARVLCSTCHDPHRQNPDDGEAPEDNFLRISNTAGYGLCMECHPGRERVKHTVHDLAVSAPNEKNSLGQVAAQAGVCGACHLVHHAASDLKLWAKPLGEGSDGISRLCNSCHQADGCASSKLIGTNSHPLGVNVIRAEGKAGLPLFTPEGQPDELNGRVYCSTCHDPHQWDPQNETAGPGVKQEGHQGNSFLRIANSPKASLCQSCHPSAMEVENSPHNLNQRKRTVSENSCTPCHRTHNSVQKLMLWARKPGPSVIKNWNAKLTGSQNRMVSLCTGCHSADKSGQAKQPEYALHPGNMLIVQKQVVPGLTQPESGFDYRFGPLRIRLTIPVLSKGLSPRFPLFALDGKPALEGNITCPTCHDPHRWQPVAQNNPSTLTRNFLRPGTASGLCSDCHAYDALYRFAYYHRAGRTIDPSKIVTGSKHHKSGGQTKPCDSCHKPGEAPVEAHPVGVAVKEDQEISRPDDLPLNADRITCATCHDMRLTAENPYLLRLHDAEPIKTFSWTNQESPLYKQSRYVLCFSCHQREKYLQFSPHRNQINHRGEINRELCLLCHYEVPDRRTTDLRRAKLRGRIEQQCIGCHPGKTKGHPMDKDHFGKRLSLADSEKLRYFTRQIKVFVPLINNKISCPTCHNPHQQGVLQNENTRKGAEEKGRLRLVGYEGCSICHRKGYNITPQPGSPW
jgi:predicted CXXCH cytochrome family protein